MDGYSDPAHQAPRKGRWSVAQIRELISNEAEVWGVKDVVREEHILDENPVAMNKTRFEKYLKAYKTAKVIEHLSAGVNELDELESLIRHDIAPVVSAWHKRSAEIRQGKLKHDRMVKRHRNYTAVIDPDKGE